jgi:hypothetical protein
VFVPTSLVCAGSNPSSVKQITQTQVGDYRCYS